MCAEYTLKASERDLSALLNISLTNHTPDRTWDRHVRLYTLAPVITRQKQGYHLQDMHFSLLPRGGRISFSANTRLDDWDERRGLVPAFERPLWREAFFTRRCLVPATEFLEPIYTGEHQGRMMAFFDPDSPVLFMAGIYQTTVDNSTGEFFKGFSLLTDFAHPVVKQAGHHRTVITLTASAALEWIREDVIDGHWAMEFLLRNKSQMNLNTRPAREMKNWQARVGNALKKSAREESIQEHVEKARKDWLFKHRSDTSH